MEDKYDKLLHNLEENIFLLVQKRFKKPHSKLVLTDKYNEPVITPSYILTNLNIKLSYNEEIVSLYNLKFSLEMHDVDILNLIIKYVDICGKIQELEIKSLFGVKSLDFDAKSIIKYLDPDYILRKYQDNYGWYIDKDIIHTFRIIFLNIVIPYSIKQMRLIYDKF